MRPRFDRREAACQPLYEARLRHGQALVRTDRASAYGVPQRICGPSLAASMQRRREQEGQRKRGGGEQEGALNANETAGSCDARDREGDAGRERGGVGAD